jgi:predicted GNAT family acetyltransferase
MYEVVRHSGAATFLEKVEGFLLQAEDRHNLILGLAYGLAERDGGGVYFATVEGDGDVVGCALRTPPHKLLVTELPVASADALARSLSEAYREVPAVLGPVAVAESIAASWAALHGRGYRAGMKQRIYRLDCVRPPRPVGGALRPATTDDHDLAVTWGDGFARDTGIALASTRSLVPRWIERGQLFVWDDDGPRCIAVAHGRTPKGVRIGYVYTPPEHRRSGYASACVASLSQRELDGGARFCVLYTDLSNPTSNSIYTRIGYRAIADVQDFVIESGGST